MIKVDIVNEVSRAAQVTKVKAELAVDAVFDAMRLSMQRGERIELRGFGVFQVKPRKRGIGRNPTDRQGSSYPARPDHPLQARQRTPEYRRMNRHLGLFLLTVLTTTAAGARHYNDFLDSFGTRPRLAELDAAGARRPVVQRPVPRLPDRARVRPLLRRRAGTACARRFPTTCPAPLPLTGSLGAVIVFRGHFPNRRVLFDFAAGGPLAGFVVAVVALACGLAWSPVEKLPEHFVGYWMGEPLLFQWLTHAVAGPVRDGWSLNLHPTALAGWLGLLFTMMNLVPISQLDGGHIAYAAIRRHSRWLTLAGLATLAFFIVWWQAYNWVAVGARAPRDHPPRRLGAPGQPRRRPAARSRRASPSPCC